MADERLERIEAKIDKVVGHISSIDSTLAANTVSLVDHIRRTELLEADVAPLKKDRNMVYGALKFVGLIATICVCIEGITSLLIYLRH